MEHNSRTVSLALGALFLVSVLTTGEARSQCTLSSGPTLFEPASGGPQRPSNFATGFTNGLDLYVPNSGSPRLLVMESYGYATFSLTNPAAPSILGYHDMSSTVPQGGDGQSIVVSLAAAGDASRALVNWKQTPYGTFLMKPFGTVFNFAGNYSGPRAIGGVVVVPVGERYLAYSLTQSALLVADVTSFVLGTGAVAANTITSETVTAAPSGTLANHLVAAGRFIAYSTGTEVVVVDSAGAGPAGTISWGLDVHRLSPQDFGLSPSSKILNVAAAIHPVNGKLYVLAEGGNSSYTSNGIGLVSTAVGPFAPMQVGSTYHAAHPYEDSTSTTSAASTMVATATDVLAFLWENDGTTSVSKLFGLSVNAWGSDLTPAIGVDSDLVTRFNSPRSMRGMASGQNVYLYVAAGQGGFAFALSCAAAPQKGDANGDGAVDVLDVFGLVSYLFAAGSPPIGDGDVDGSGEVDVLDVFYLVNHLFAGGPAPV
jgi:hypothetical protein